MKTMLVKAATIAANGGRLDAAHYIPGGGNLTLYAYDASAQKAWRFDSSKKWLKQLLLRRLGEHLERTPQDERAIQEIWRRYRAVCDRKEGVDQYVLRLGVDISMEKLLQCIPTEISVEELRSTGYEEAD